MKYPSKVDLWLAILIWGSMLGTIGIGLYAIFYESSSYWEVMFLLLSCVLLPHVYAVGVLYHSLSGERYPFNYPIWSVHKDDSTG
ncbi:hypothetical protein R3398_03440 [Rossellomorea marisflavi]|uniref:hypothetical protein n=1 Tax=Rossellomorea marisflavi TaxID=189381 RepID=UPI00296E2EA8|nr:hypothetical protein [Rossellomorea marisflavi]MDW4525427.1 hypothetical protein [Rossellomorea marisflavi]